MDNLFESLYPSKSLESSSKSHSLCVTCCRTRSQQQNQSTFHAANRRLVSAYISSVCKLNNKKDKIWITSLTRDKSQLGNTQAVESNMKIFNFEPYDLNISTDLRPSDHQVTGEQQCNSLLQQLANASQKDRPSTLILADAGALFVANNNNHNHVLRYLYRLKHFVFRVFIFVNADELNINLLVKLHYLADTFVDVNYDVKSQQYSADMHLSIRSKTMAPPKKIGTSCCFKLSVSSIFTVVFEPLKQDADKSGNHAVIDMMIDSTDQLSAAIGPLPFNLGLTGDERKARDMVTLPYIGAQDPDKSKIFYYPDKNDDVDEEDPDDDLNI